MPTIAPITAFAGIFALGIVWWLLGSSHPIGRGWANPPIGPTQVRMLARGMPLRHSDVDSEFMLIAPGDTDVNVLEKHGIFQGQECET